NERKSRLKSVLRGVETTPSDLAANDNAGTGYSYGNPPHKEGVMHGRRHLTGRTRTAQSRERGTERQSDQRNDHQGQRERRRLSVRARAFSRHPLQGTVGEAAGHSG